MLGRLFGRKQSRVVVLGLDGVPYSLLNRFAEDGVMPNVARLRGEGTLCSMTASIPEVSSTSWSTFMTGVNPGRHGIYGFMELDRDSYAWRFPNFGDLKAKTIWELAGQRGKRSIVMNVPSTYPARALNGMLVSGFVALDLKKASYPEEMYRYLEGIGYRLDVDASKAATAADEFADDILRTFRKRVEAVHHLYDSRDWDLFIAAVTETDRLHHYLWAALEDPSHTRHGFFLDFYRELDRFIGALYDKVGPDTPFLMLSDHGFTSIKKEVNLNVFLKERGYLRFVKEEPGSFQDIAEGSRAFALDPSRLYVHRRGTYARGSVANGGYEDLRNSLREDLLSLEVDGVKVIREVFFKEDLYHGACLAEAPDLVVLAHEGYDLKGAVNRKELSGRGPLTGGHTRDNALLYINRAIACDSPNIIDVGVTALTLLGVDGADLEGRPLL